MKKKFSLAITTITILFSILLPVGNVGAVTTIPTPRKPFHTIRDKTPTYQWVPVAEATTYRIQLWKGKNKIYTRGASSSVCNAKICKRTYSVTLTPGLYRWRVRAKVGGVWKPFSAYKPFYVTPAGVKVLRNSTTYMGYSSRYVLGEIYNNTSSYLSWIKVSVNFFNNGKLVATDFTYTDLNVLHPYEGTCFRIFVYPAPTTWTSYSFEPVSFDKYGEERPKIAIANRNGGVYNGYYRILGQLRNDDTVPIQSASVIATLYNANGKVIECDYDYANNSNLKPGQISSFEILANPAIPRNVKSTYLQTDGRR